MNLTRGADDGADLLEQLLEVLSKELDHMSTSSTALIWSVILQIMIPCISSLLWLNKHNMFLCCNRTDTARDEKGSTITSSQHNILELSALVFCRVFRSA